MRHFLKILSIIIVSLLTLMLLLSVLVKVFEDDLAKVAIKQVSKNIKAPVDINSVNFNLIRGFPKATVEFKDLWLMSPEKQNDTIAGIKHLYISVNSRAAIKGRYEVEKMEIDGMAMHYSINTDSISNIDFLMSLIPATDSTQTESNDSISDSTALLFDLRHLLLKNIICSYYDATSNTGARVQIPKITLKGNIMGDDYTAETDGNVTITDIRFGDYNLQLMKEASLDFMLHYIGDSVLIDKFMFQSDGINLSTTGFANVGDNMTVNAAVKCGKIDLGVLSKYIPEKMMQDYGIISMQGILNFNTQITGGYNDSVMPWVNADFAFNNGAFITTQYPEIRHFAFSGKATNGASQNNFTTSIDLNSLEVATPQSHLNFSAHIKNIDHPIYKIKTNGSVLLDEFAAFIPKDALEKISGKVDWDISSYGTLPDKIEDDFTDYAMKRTQAKIFVQNLNATVDSSLSIENFNTVFTYEPYHFKITNLSLGVPSYNVAIKNTTADIAVKGSINDIDNMACDINNFHLEFDNNSLDLKASVSNLTDPDYMMDGTINLDLADLQRFVPDSLVTAMSGTLNGHIYSAGYLNLDSIETQAMPLAFESTTVELNCNDINVAMPDTLMEVADLNLTMNMIPDTIAIDHFSANYKGLDFAIDSTKIFNAYHSVVLNEKEELKVLTSIKIGDIDYAMFEPFMVVDSTTSEIPDTTSTDSTVTNYTMDIKGDIAVSSLILENYEVDSTMTINNLDIDNISAKFRVKDSIYIVDSLIFNALGGNMNTSILYEIKPDSISNLSLHNRIDGMDFKQLMSDMDNFGQNDFKAENISGKLISDTYMETTIVGTSFPKDKIRLRGDFTLIDGGVYDFEPAKKLSKFTGINELDNIKFLSLKTNLFVYNGKAYVPKTNIVNTAVDVTVFGMQSLVEDEYDYHLELNLGDVLTGKREALMKRQAKADKENDEDVERNGVNLLYKKEDDKIKYGFDRKKAMDFMERKIKVQKRILDMVFYPKRFNFDTENNRKLKK